MIDLDKPLEGVDYIIEPIDMVDNEQAWKAKVRTGPFRGLSLIYTKMQYDGKASRLKYVLDVLDKDLNRVGVDQALDDYAFNVIVDIIKTGIANGSVVFDDKDSNN